MLEPADPEFMSLVPDYKVHLIQPAALSEEDLKKVHKNFRVVMNFLKYSGGEEKLAGFLNQEEELKNLSTETAMVINACANLNLNINENMEVTDMCQAWQDMMKHSGEKGMEKGQMHMLYSLVKKRKLSPEAAAEEAGMSVNEFCSCMNQYLSESGEPIA